MRLVAAGVSYRTAPLAVRERVAVSASEATNLLRYLVGHAGLSAAAVLSTCNRTDFYVMCPTDALADQVVPRLVRYLDSGSGEGLSAHLVGHRDEAAVAHMFRVAAGLESMVLGEAQVLGQFKQAHQLAREANSLDPRLDFVMRRAVSAAKRVHTETAVGRRAGNLSEVALERARSVVGDLAGRGVLLIGAGTMSDLAARRLRQLGARLFVTSRSGVTASELAARLGQDARAVDRVEDVSDCIDVILASTSSPVPVLRRADVVAMQAARHGRPLCLLDIAVPRDIDPDAGSIPGVVLMDLDSLGDVVASNLLSRERAAIEAATIIDAEVARTVAVVGARDAAGPTIAALTQRAERLRAREVERTLSRLPGIDGETRTRIDALTRSIVSKLLHPPIAHLREAHDDPAVALGLRTAFALDGGDSDPASAPLTSVPTAGSRS